MNDNEMHSEDRESVPPEAEAKRKPHKLLIAAAITLAAGLAILVPALILGDPFLAVLAIMCACAAIVLLIIWLIRRFAYTREHKLRTNALDPVFSVVAYLLTPAFLFAGLSIVFFVYVIGGLLLIVALALPLLALALGIIGITLNAKKSKGWLALSIVGAALPVASVAVLAILFGSGVAVISLM